VFQDSDLRTIAAKAGIDPNYFEAFVNKTFIEGPGTARRLTDFFVLLVLATVIATYGVLSDSTATVIGAMIVAPLMGPMMACAAGVVMGSPRRAVRALVLVVAGSALVVGLAAVLALVVPDVTISFRTNGEIASRTSPGVYALFTALAAGAAGAYILSRKELADSMGGVAIAISLVPPLCVVGIALAHGQHGAAVGALLLFLTNFLAILLAGGATFMAGGLRRLAVSQSQTSMRRRAFALIALATVLVAIPLALSGLRATGNALLNRAASGAVDEWLSGTPHHAAAVVVAGNQVTVRVEGPGDLPELDDLAQGLEEALGQPVLVTVFWSKSLLAASPGAQLP
jgi:uncharacterized hydrophobic protein (TIGR00271 family)